jgi:predicted transcriptional regulator
MPENEAPQGNEKLLILPLGEESRKLTQVISNDTARQIIELLADAPLSASDIAEHLKSPLTTIVYNLENLESVGLIKIDKIKYSKKGREVRIYAPVRKLIVVVPEKTDRKSISDILRKYVGVMLAAVFTSSIIELVFFRADSPLLMMEKAAPLMPEGRDMIRSAPDMFINIADTVTSHPGLMFLLGCIFVILLLTIWDVCRRKRNGN